MKYIGRVKCFSGDYRHPFCLVFCLEEKIFPGRKSLSTKNINSFQLDKKEVFKAIFLFRMPSVYL